MTRIVFKNHSGRRSPRRAQVVGAALLFVAASTVSVTGFANPEGAAAASEPKAAASAGPKVLMLPFQAIYRSVEQAKAQTATDLLNKELSKNEGMEIVRGAVGGDEGNTRSLEEANKLIQEALQHEKEHRIEAAIEAHKKAIASMEKNAGAIDDAELFIGAHHSLSRALMWAGKDEETQKMLEVAARMDPNFEIDRASFSRLYRKWFDEAAKKVVREKTGDITVKSALPGAKVSLDGRPMDVAPVLLKKVVPGKHLLSADVEGVPRYGTMVDVKPGGNATVMVSFSNTLGGDAVGAVTDAIAENSLGRKAVESAAQAGKAVGASYVLAGGMARTDENFRVHTFVVDVASRTVKPLDVVQFDLDLLTAESDVLRIVQHVDGAVKAFSGGQKEVASIEKTIRPQSTMNTVSAAPPPRGTKTMRATRGGKEPVRRVFTPLKAGTIKIKDEEE